jgi:hypothetical protein
MKWCENYGYCSRLVTEFDKINAVGPIILEIALSQLPNENADPERVAAIFDAAMNGTLGRAIVREACAELPGGEPCAHDCPIYQLRDQMLPPPGE